MISELQKDSYTIISDFFIHYLLIPQNKNNSIGKFSKV